MKVKESIRFSPEAYAEKIRQEDFTYHTIAFNIYRKRRNLASATACIVTGIMAAPVTHGVSLVGTAISSRNRIVEKKKLGLLEGEWRRRGQESLPKRPFKDVVIPVVLALGACVYSFTLDISLKLAEDMALAHCVSAIRLNGYGVGALYTCLDKGINAALIEHNHEESEASHKHLIEIQEWDD